MSRARIFYRWFDDVRQGKYVVVVVVSEAAPRHPLEFTLFEDRYPELTDEVATEAMRVMGEGYFVQDYYKRMKAESRLTVDREETFTYDDYSWTEHIARKWGQWDSDPKELLDPLSKCGFVICRKHKRTA